MRALLFSTLAIAVALSATPARADDGKAAVAFGRCLVKLDRNAAIGLLSSLPLAGEKVALTGLSLGAGAKCAEANAAEPLNVVALRGGLAQELFRRDFGEFGLEPRGSTASFARFRLPVEKDAMGVQEPARTLYVAADCVARNTPKNVERMLKAEPGSALEDAAFERMAPWFSACGMAPGSRISRVELRGAMAQASYFVSMRYWLNELSPTEG